MIAVIDYGGGNIGSVVNALKELGINPAVTDKFTRIMKADAVFLPGVGAAGDTMRSLDEKGITEAVKKLIEVKRPLFAICVGLQVLLSTTEEGGEYKCMNIIPGRVKRFPAGLKIPHMGWNQVTQVVKHPVFNNIADNTNFYFVHSYYADPVDKSVIAGTTEYSNRFCSMIIKDNLFATQFHPEKSGEPGLTMYSNFLKIAGVSV
jgi:imidazole glycerol-phosphate synthase subunit HisH